jgi:two-component system sensor histidine kinase DesK
MDRRRGQQRDQARAREPGQDGENGLTLLPRGLWPSRQRRFNWHLGTLVWLAYLLPGVADLLSKPLNARTAVELALLGVFVAGYAYVLARPPWDSARPLPGRPLVLAVMAAVTAVLVLRFDPRLISLLIYFDVAWVMLLSMEQAVRAVLLATAVAAAVALWQRQPADTVALDIFQVLFSGGAVLAFRRMAALNRQLHEAHEDLAELAVTEERLRFARDLHDLLGHSLSLIVLKSELAEQLLAADRSPGGATSHATNEVRDIKEVARRSLAEVREAVGGYRRVTLAAELAGARAALDAAGIAATIDEALRGLPGPVDEVLGWTVREGVTNLVRHSGASTCRIRFESGRGRGRAGAATGRAAVEITDNGQADIRAIAAPANGSGLAGLAERAAERGGRLQAGPQPGGGFRLRVELPLELELEPGPEPGPGPRPRSQPEATRSERRERTR